MRLFNEVINNNENEAKKIKNRSHIYNINGTRPRHGDKYAKYKMFNIG